MKYSGIFILCLLISFNIINTRNLRQDHKYKRIFVIVVDSMGIGPMPDSEKFGDVGVDTLGHIDQTQKSFKIPNLQKLGIGNLKKLKNVPPVEKPLAYYMAMREKSVGKDTMTGHWEMMGLYITKPFKTFTDTGFPQELLDELSKKTGHKIVGNKSASGTVILDELGEHQMKTGDMIVYTSADSVLQICGHEETFGLQELYRCCQIAREITMKDEWKVGRIIARPYVGPGKGHFTRTSNRVGRIIARPYVGPGKGHFTRTSNRHDYALKPYGRTVLNELKDNNFDVISVGKIKDIFDGEGITEAYKSKSSVHGMEQTIEIMDKDFTGLCFVNLVDFDALWGHRRNVDGYAREIEKFDVNLGKVLEKMKQDDLLIITADHGNDPTYTGSDHTREKVPFLAYSPSMKGHGNLESSETFADIGATIADNFGIKMPENTIGSSLLDKLN